VRNRRWRCIAGNVPIRLSYAALLRNVPSVASGGEQPALRSFGEHKKSYCKLLCAIFAGAVGGVRERRGPLLTWNFDEHIRRSVRPRDSPECHDAAGQGRPQKRPDFAGLFYGALCPAVLAGVMKKVYARDSGRAIKNAAG